MNDTVRVFIPVGREPAQQQARVQSEIHRSANAPVVIGLLDNHKHNTDKLLDRLQERLSQQYGEVRFVRAKKPEAGKSAPKKLIEDLAAECSAVINGIGD
jgi:hypothetical protein